MLDELLSVTDAIFQSEKDEFSQLEDMEVTVVTNKAARIGGRWIPLSILRCDSQRNLYVKNWFYDKEIQHLNAFSPAPLTKRRRI